MSISVPSSGPYRKDPVWSEEIASQTIDLTDIFGNVDTFSLSDFDDYFQRVCRSLIIFGVNIGICVTIAIVLLVLTKPYKRRTPIFVLNLAGLFLQFFRVLMASLNETGPSFTISVALLSDTSTTPQSAFVTYYLYIVATIFWYMVIITSLILQVRIVFATEQKSQKYLTWSLVLLGLATMGFNITGQGDLCKVTIITGAQCLIVPLAFTIADNYVNIYGFVAVGQTFLTCSLPLSALWVSTGKHSVVQAKPSTCSGKYDRPVSKKNVFHFWLRSKETQESVISEVEKGSYVEDSDHVIVRRTLQAVTSTKAN